MRHAFHVAIFASLLAAPVALHPISTPGTDPPADGPAMAGASLCGRPQSSVQRLVHGVSPVLLQMWHAVCPVLAQMWEGIRGVSCRDFEAACSGQVGRSERARREADGGHRREGEDAPVIAATHLCTAARLPLCRICAGTGLPPAAPALALADSDSADRLRQVRASALNVERETVDAICKLSNPPLPVRDVLVCIRPPSAPCACRKHAPCAMRHAPWHWPVQPVRAVLVRTQPTARPAQPGTYGQRAAPGAYGGD
jgi:hypothetical protein